LVATTDRIFSLVTAEGRIADVVRTRLVPLIFPKIVALKPVREEVNAKIRDSFRRGNSSRQ